jgi:hypothetical protein
MGIAYTRTPTSLTLIVNFRPHIIPSSHPNFKQLSELATKPNTTERDITPLLDIPTAITSFTGDEIKVVNGKLYYRGSEVKNNLATVILNFVKSGDPAAALPFQKFLANCRNNPDLALVDTIYDWCVKGNLPITPDGQLLAWKIVQSDFYSKRAGKRGKLRHQIGDVVTEPREECNPNRNQTCSTGIHFCSMEYVESGSYGSFDSGDRLMAVTVNPADITAIPTDYNLSKGRCCKLTVVGEVPHKAARDYYGTARVYDWSPAPVAPARKVRTWTGDLKPGDVVRLRDGRETTVRSVACVGVVKLAIEPLHVHARTGRDAGSDTPESDRYYDVIDVIRRAPKIARTRGGFAVGQTWMRRNGSRVAIATARDGSGYPIVDDGGNVYTATGRFNSDSSVSQFDLVRLTKDVG